MPNMTQIIFRIKRKTIERLLRYLGATRNEIITIQARKRLQKGTK